MGQNGVIVGLAVVMVGLGNIVRPLKLLYGLIYTWPNFEGVLLKRVETR